MGYDIVRFSLFPSDVVGFTEAQRLSVELQANISISNEANWLYKNFKHPRYENFYGYAQLMSGDFVIKDIPLKFINQELLHWQDSSVNIVQTLGCSIKVVLQSLTPPVSSQVELNLLRQRYTGIRFRLLPGIEANLVITWQFIEQLCDEEINAPPENQGNPPAPDNYPSPPGSGRGSQPGDLKAPSNNDGDFSPTDGKPKPPEVGGSLPGFWRFGLYYGAPYNDTFYLTVAGAPTDTVITYTIGPLAQCTADRYVLKNVTRDILAIDDNCVSNSESQTGIAYFSN